MKFETYEAEPGTYRWRLRDEDGEIVNVKPGRIMGLEASASKTKTSERVVNEALKRLAGGGDSRRTSNRQGRPKRAAEA